VRRRQRQRRTPQNTTRRPLGRTPPPWQGQQHVQQHKRAAVLCLQSLACLPQPRRRHNRVQLVSHGCWCHAGCVLVSHGRVPRGCGVTLHVLEGVSWTPLLTIVSSCCSCPAACITPRRGVSCCPLGSHQGDRVWQRFGVGKAVTCTDGSSWCRGAYL
jgi:hypothetical protein